MKTIYEKLQNYFNTTSEDQVRKDWENSFYYSVEPNNKKEYYNMEVDVVKYDYEGMAKAIEAMSKLYPLIKDEKVANNLLTQIIIPKTIIKEK